MAEDRNRSAMDVGYVANLARIELTPEETARFQEQLDQVLDYVRQLEELDVEGVEPTAHAFPVENVFREDVPRPGMKPEEAERNAPSWRKGQFGVPRILE
jgi:aspartyl-tRNA(Asn)/glutamyl-tRNA(Gln) amidotransferase subunit C